MLALSGVKILSFSMYLPGPFAAARLAEMGADVTKVEPPQGDPLRHHRPDWFKELHAKQKILSLDLKSPEGKAQVMKMLESMDLVITNFRPAALERLGLSWAILAKKFPRLLGINIVGYGGKDANLPGHDINFQAKAGILTSDHLPRLLIADIAGAEDAVAEALKLLYARERLLPLRFSEVSITAAATRFSGPLRHGDTAPGELIGGGFIGYGIYTAKVGKVAIAALEPKFWQIVLAELGLKEDCTKEQLASAFLLRTASAWNDFGKKAGVPLVAVEEDAYLI